MSKLTKIFLSCIAVVVIVPTVLTTKAEKPKIEPTVDAVESKNIIELDSRKFINLTSGNKVLTVYQVYGQKILVVEGESGKVELINLN